MGTPDLSDPPVLATDLLQRSGVGGRHLSRISSIRLQRCRALASLLPRPGVGVAPLLARTLPSRPLRDGSATSVPIPSCRHTHKASSVLPPGGRAGQLELRWWRGRVPRLSRRVSGPRERGARLPEANRCTDKYADINQS